MRRPTWSLVVLLATSCGVIAGWCAHDAFARPAAAAIQGQAISAKPITAIAVCFGTNNPPAGWSLPSATANTLANGNYRIAAVLPAAGPPGCPNPEIVWGQTQ
jgi:hypothetical protein